MWYFAFYRYVDLVGSRSLANKGYTGRSMGSYETKLHLLFYDRDKSEGDFCPDATYAVASC